MSTRNLRAMTFIFMVSTGLGLSVSCSDDDDDDGGPSVAGYCAAKCDNGIACEGEAEADREVCEQDCVSLIEADLANWDGVCVTEWLTSETCIAEATTQNGCDEETAEGVTCEEEILAKTNCYCSEMCIPSLLGNGSCDGACNSAECDYDDGDCA
jgi:hypothetical protein